MWLKVELVLPVHRLLPQEQNTKESVLGEGGSAVKSTYCYTGPRVSSTVHGGSITLALGNLLPSLASTSTRHATWYTHVHESKAPICTQSKCK